MITKIYELKLNESVKEGDSKITRVPGGWVYLQNEDEKISMVFVPFHKEFDSKGTSFDIR